MTTPHSSGSFQSFSNWSHSDITWQGYRNWVHTRSFCSGRSSPGMKTFIPTKHSIPKHSAYSPVLSRMALTIPAFERQNDLICYMPQGWHLTITFTAVGDVNHPLSQPISSVYAILPSITAIGCSWWRPPVLLKGSWNSSLLGLWHRVNWSTITGVAHPDTKAKNNLIFTHTTLRTPVSEKT